MAESVDDYMLRAREELKVSLYVHRHADDCHAALAAPLPVIGSATSARTLCERPTAIEAARDGFAILKREHEAR